MNNKYYSIFNTCTFDSIFQVLCVLYDDFIEYAQFIHEKVEKHIIFKIIVCVVRYGINLQTYKKRSNIIFDIHKNQKLNITENMVNINCATIANYLLGKLSFFVEK